MAINYREKMVAARRALHALWKKADLRGRCWGLRKDGKNPFAGSNVTLAKGDEMISVCQDSESGEHIVHEFRRVGPGQTKLGKEARRLLTVAGLSVIGKRPVKRKQDDPQKRQREIFQALAALGGRATSREIATQLGRPQQIQGVARSLGALVSTRRVKCVSGEGRERVWVMLD